MKTIKKLNLTQLIEHLDETYSDLEKVRFFETRRGVSVGFRRRCAEIVIYVQNGSGMLSLDDTFDVEVETKVTENTFFSSLVELRENAFQGEEPKAHNLTNTSVLKEQDDESLEFHAVIDNKLVKVWDKEEGFINE